MNSNNLDPKRLNPNAREIGTGTVKAMFSVQPETKRLANEIGEGNMSAGIDKAVQAYALSPQKERDRMTALHQWYEDLKAWAIATGNDFDKVAYFIRDVLYPAGLMDGLQEEKINQSVAPDKQEAIKGFLVRYEEIYKF